MLVLAAVACKNKGKEWKAYQLIGVGTTPLYSLDLSEAMTVRFL